MAKLTRAGQRPFAGSSGFQQVAQFGSLANSTPNFTLNPVTIQALSQFVTGWFDAVIGGNSPAIEDMNALFFLTFYQLGYVLQEGVPEWDATTTYYVGSVVQDGTGAQYLSTLNTNLNNNPASGGPGWFPIGTVGLLNATIGAQTLPASRRLTSPSPVTLASASTVNVPATTIASIPDSVTVPTGSSLIVAPGGSVRVI